MILHKFSPEEIKKNLPWTAKWAKYFIKNYRITILLILLVFPNAYRFQSTAFVRCL